MPHWSEEAKALLIELYPEARKKTRTKADCTALLSKRLAERGEQRTPRGVEWMIYALEKQGKLGDPPHQVNEREVMEAIERGIKQAEVMRKATGIEREVVIPVPEDGWFAVVYGSDWHIGSIWAEMGVILRESYLIGATPHVYYAFGGDAVDGGVPKGPVGGIINDSQFPPSFQRLVASKIAKNIGEKMLFACSGCHEWWTKDAADYDFIKEAFSHSGCRYLGGGGNYYLMCDGGAEYKGWYSHKPEGHSMYNPFHPCVRRVWQMDGGLDIVCVAHEHFYGAARQYCQGRPRLFARTGARKSFDTFGSKIGDDPNRATLDVPVALLHGTRKEMHWVTGIERAITTLEGWREADEKEEK